MREQSKRVRVLLVGALLLLPTACKKSEPKAEVDEVEPVASNKPAAMNAKIANAVQAAAEQAAAEEAGQHGQGNSGDLPPNGLLTAAQADAKTARGALNTMTLGGTGKEPRIVLGAPAKSVPLVGQLELAVRTGPRSALPTLVLTLGGQRKIDAGKVNTQLDVKNAQLSADQPGQIPEELAKLVPTLKGGSLSWQGQVGEGRGPIEFKVPPTVQADFEVVLQAAAESLETIALPFPSEAVGEGAYWMSQSRERFYQADVLAFRLIKVEAVDGQKARLNVSTKRYLVGDNLAELGLPPHTVQQYEGSGEAQFVVAAGRSLPEQCQSTDVLNAAVSLPDRPDQPLPIQVGVKAKCQFPGSAP